MSAKKGILERLNAGEVLIGDGGFVFALEKRGYVMAGSYTPEVSVENPEAVLQLHREFGRAGTDVVQAFTFCGTDDHIEVGSEAAAKIGSTAINQASCSIAKQVAAEFNCFWLGGVSQTNNYANGEPKEKVQDVLRKQIDIFIENKCDLLLAEYFENVEEAVWAVEVMKESGLPVAATLAISPECDLNDVPTGECAVRLVKAGVDIVGVNCRFDPNLCLKAIKAMKEGLEDAGLKAHLMVQPVGLNTPDVGKGGFTDLPECPFAFEPRTLTRFDVHKFAREAYDLGVRYIGGCCGFEPYHIRAISQELELERGRTCISASKHPSWGRSLTYHPKPWVRKRANREYWENLKPATGRPFSPAMTKPDGWDISRKKTAEEEKDLKNT